MSHRRATLQTTTPQIRVNQSHNRALIAQVVDGAVTRVEMDRVNKTRPRSLKSISTEREGGERVHQMVGRTSMQLLLYVECQMTAEFHVL